MSDTNVDEFFLEGTKITYEEWAEVSVNDRVCSRWDALGRLIPDYDVVILHMEAEQSGFNAIVLGKISNDFNMLFEIRYDQATKQTLFMEYAATDVRVTKSSF